jgi:hypothetical protein
MIKPTEKASVEINVRQTFVQRQKFSHKGEGTTSKRSQPEHLHAYLRLSHLKLFYWWSYSTEERKYIFKIF